MKWLADIPSLLRSKIAERFGPRAMLAVNDREVVLFGPSEPKRRFEIPDALSWDAPAELGEAFRAFLTANKVSIRAVKAVALPAQWLTVRTTSLPPAKDLSTIPGMVQLAAPELFAERIEELACGYAWESTGEAINVTIAACNRSRLEHVREFCRAAGLKVSAIVPLAMLLPLVGTPEDEFSVLLGVGSCLELVDICRRRVVGLTWLRVCADDVGAVGSEMSRLQLAGARRHGIGLHVMAGPDVARGLEGIAGDWKLTTADQDPCQVIAQVCGGTALPGELNLLVDRDGGPHWARNLPWRRAGLGAACAILLMGWGGLRWHSVRSQASSANAALQDLSVQAEQARRLQKLLSGTAPWFDRSNRNLEAMKALTSQFPDEASIWLSNLEVDEDGHVALVGKARNREEVLSLLGRLESSNMFSEVTAQYIRQQSGGDAAVSFAVTCRYGVGGKA